MIKPEVLDAMLAAGCTAEQIVAAVKASIPAKSSGAIRQARYRERHVTSRNVTDRNGDDAPLSPFVPPDKEIPPTPPKENNPPISPKPRRGSRLPAEFQADIGFAISLGLTSSQANAELAKFTDYWNAKAGKDAAKLDWQGTWRNWIRNSAERLPRAGPMNGRETVSSVANRLLKEMENAESPSLLEIDYPPRQRLPSPDQR